jgi:hypothetical protein
MLRIGRIYKIVHSRSDAIYVGSTFNSLKQRFASHKSTNSSKTQISELIKQHGADQFKIMLIKEYEVVDKKHLLAYESLWISKLKCINSNTPFRVIKMYQKQYYAREDVKHRIKQKSSTEEFKKHRRELRKKYREHEKAYDKARRAVMPKFNCDICGGSCKMGDKQRHLKSKMHMKALANQEVN